MKGIGLERNAVVTVHQPDEGHAWVNIGYAGFVVGPPFIGFLGEVLGLSLALGVVVAGAAIIAMSARLAAAADP